jgi:hypothetical protein
MATYKKVVVENSAGNIAQNSASATQLATARNFSATGDVTTGGSVTSFNGTGNVALSLSIASDAVDHTHIADGSITHTMFRDRNGNASSGSSGQFLKNDGGGAEWADVPSPNNNTITLDAGTGLTGGGDFTVNQSSDETLTFNLDSSVAGVGLTMLNGVVSVNSTQAINTLTGNLAIAGDLTVSGKTITTATETLEIADNTMLLNSDLTGSTAVDTGIVANRADATGDKYKHLFWDESKGAWAVGSDDSSSAFPATSTALMINVNKAGAPSSSDVEAPVGGVVYDSSNAEMYLRTA